MLIRRYQPADCEALAGLFFETVHTVNAKDYAPEQLDAWAGGEIDLAEWDCSFRSHDTVVAQLGEEIAGFGDLTEEGYLDRLYVHKSHQRKGVATAICDALEERFRGSRITTHASITAREFFAKRGYRLIRAQQVERRGVLLTNYVMEKNLS